MSEVGGYEDEDESNCHFVSGAHMARFIDVANLTGILLVAQGIGFTRIAGSAAYESFLGEGGWKGIDDYHASVDYKLTTQWYERTILKKEASAGLIKTTCKFTKIGTVAAHG